MNSAAAICFDLIGTLLDLSRIQEALALTCGDIAAHHPGISASQLLHWNTEVWRAYWLGVERRWTVGELDDETVGLEAWRRAIRACGCDEEQVVHSARQTHRRWTHELTRAFDDVQYLFDWLCGRCLPLAIITNGASGSQRDGLRILGTERRFGTVVISGEVHVAKPDPAIFTLAIHQLGCEPTAGMARGRQPGRGCGWRELSRAYECLAESRRKGSNRPGACSRLRNPLVKSACGPPSAHGLARHLAHGRPSRRSAIARCQAANS